MEEYLSGQGFDLIEKEFVTLWEMWLACFVKRKHKSDITKVSSGKIRKGLGKMIGNKGGVAQSFMVKNRLFSFIAVHLKHGQKNQELRNEMAQ